MLLGWSGWELRSCEAADWCFATGHVAYGEMFVKRYLILAIDVMGQIFASRGYWVHDLAWRMYRVFRTLLCRVSHTG